MSLGSDTPHPRLMVAPTGARRGRSDHPRLPITTEQIASCAAECRAAGADAIHLHVRDAAGCHSLDAAAYKDAISAVTDRVPDMSIQVSTESAGIFTVPDQYALLRRLRPAWASVSVREIARDPGLAPSVYCFCQEAEIEVQHILYDASDVETLRRWIGVGVVPAGHTSVLLVLGSYAQQQAASPSDVAHRLAAVRDFPDRMVCAFGPSEAATLAAAHRLGADVRIGFENNIHRPDGSLLQDMTDSIAQFRTAVARTPQLAPA